MVFPGIWFIFGGQNRGPYNREPVYLLHPSIQRPCMMTRLRWRLVVPKRRRMSQKGRSGRTQFLPHPVIRRRRRRSAPSASFCTAPTVAAPLSLPLPLLLSIYPPIRSPDSIAPRGRRAASVPLAPPSSSVFLMTASEEEMKS